MIKHIDNLGQECSGCACKVCGRCSNCSWRPKYQPKAERHECRFQPTDDEVMVIEYGPGAAARTKAKRVRKGSATLPA